MGGTSFSIIRVWSRVFRFLKERVFVCKHKWHRGEIFKMGTIRVGNCRIQGDRTTQQDSMQCVWKEDLLLAVICDGMGGIAGGEQASARAVWCLEQEFLAVPEFQEASILPWLVESFAKMDQAVCLLTDAEGSALGAGTTVVAAILEENRLYWGSVGDSLIYLLREGTLSPLNRRHNYDLRIAQLLEQGALTQEQADLEHAQGEALISYLGMGGLELIDTSPGAVSLQDGDVLVLCSDGLYRSLREEQIQAILEESGGNMEIAAKRLCRDASRLTRDKLDNTTVIAISYQEDDAGEDGEDEEVYGVHAGL